MENQIGKKVKRLRTDNGLELCCSEFNEFCKTEGIARLEMHLNRMVYQNV